MLVFLVCDVLRNVCDALKSSKFVWKLGNQNWLKLARESRSGPNIEKWYRFERSRSENNRNRTILQDNTIRVAHFRKYFTNNTLSIPYLYWEGIMICFIAPKCYFVMSKSDLISNFEWISLMFVLIIIHDVDVSSSSSYIPT